MSNYMKQSSSSEADSSLAGQGIVRSLWNPKAHYRVNNSPSLVPVLSHTTPVRPFASYLYKIHFNIILPSTPRSSKCSVSFRHVPWISAPYVVQSPSRGFIALVTFCEWQRRLRRASAAFHLLALWVRIPPGAWMSVCCGCCVLSGRGLCVGLITRPEESYRVWRVWAR
jgi:hypothetical protein